MKYRIVEKSDGFYYIQESKLEHWSDIYRRENGMARDKAKFLTLWGARRYIKKLKAWDKNKNPVIVKVHETLDV